ncbi:MAG: hypothetical protein JWP36_1241, partial [Paucimonas sp.]|nr:hypothetical protein [Paucimonas sp.]
MRGLSTSPPAPSAAPARQAALLHKLSQIALALAKRQIDSFRFQLGDALLHFSESTDRPVEEKASFDAHHHLKKKGDAFCIAFESRLDTLSAAALRTLERGRAADADLALATEDFDQAQHRVLQDELSDALEQHAGDTLHLLDLRVAALLGRDALDADSNPWRPQIFVQAFCQAWASIDDGAASRRATLRLLNPRLFLPLPALYGALNAVLVENGVLPELQAQALARTRQREKAMPFAATTSPAVRLRGARYHRVRDFLLGAPAPDTKPGNADTDHLNLPDLFSEPDANGKLQTNTISVAVGPRLFTSLTRLQRQLEEGGSEGGAPASASVLRHIKEGLPEGVLTRVDENTIELLARIFDVMFEAADLPAPVKSLLGRMQIPLVKAALMDRKFFLDAGHPARRFMDQLVACSVAWDAASGEQDPLFQALRHAVDRITTEFDQKTALFDQVRAGLVAFVASEEREAEAALAKAMPAAQRAERLHQAELAAQADLDERLASGAVPQFVERFLETHWFRILTLGHNLREKKPEVLVRARNSLDDLIRSLQPCTDAEDRRMRLSRLPAIVADVNAWLNAIKWDGPERATFMARLAERHAAALSHKPEGGNTRVQAAVTLARRLDERSTHAARRA